VLAVNPHGMRLEPNESVPSDKLQLLLTSMGGGPTRLSLDRLNYYYF
jgi:hypothetical protein